MDTTITSEKRDRFIRLAEARTNTVLKKLDILGNCSNRSAYEYTEEEIEKIFNAILTKVRETRARFTFPENSGFKL